MPASVWEKINNPSFSYLEFGVIKKEAGTNKVIMSVGQWIDRTKATGMLVKAERYGGTFAHKDIAFWQGYKYLLLIYTIGFWMYFTYDDFRHILRLGRTDP